MSVPWEVSLMQRGMESAYQRCEAAHDDPVVVPVAACEFIGWACALDQWLLDQRDGYRVRRDGDPAGRLLVGLRFARDRYVHQAVLPAVLAFTARQPTDAEGTAIGPAVLDSHRPAFVWRHRNDVAEPSGSLSGALWYVDRRDAYDADLAERPALPTLKAVRPFLNAELLARGVEVVE